MGRCIALAFALAGWLLGPPYAAGDDAAPQWPSEVDEELRQADEKVLELQGKLLTARLREDDAVVKRLGEEIRELDRKRVKLLQASGQL